MKYTFLSGLVTLLPVAITIWLFCAVISLVTQPFQHYTQDLFSRIGLFQTGFWNEEQILLSLFSTFFILAGIFIFILSLGYLGNALIVRSFFSLCNTLLLSVPFIGKIYKSCQDITRVLFFSQKQIFSQVAWISFPFEGQSILGFITSEITLAYENNRKYVGILIPGAPNPTSGFLLFFPKENIRETSIPVDEAMKWSISCGTADVPKLVKNIQELNQKI